MSGDPLQLRRSQAFLRRLLHQTSVMLRLIREQTDGQIEHRPFSKSESLWDSLRTVGLSKLNVKR